MKLYRITHKESGGECYQYWADAPYTWAGTSYPWADATLYETNEVLPTPTGPAYSLVEGMSWTAFDFVRRFTIQEHAAIVASADPLVQAFLNRLTFAAAQNRMIHAQDLETSAGVGYLTSIGVLAAGRGAAILGQ